MQIKATKRDHYTPTRTAKIKKTISSARKDGKQLALSNTAGGYLLQPLWQTGSQSLLKLNMYKSYASNFTLRYILKRSAYIHVPKDMYKNLYYLQTGNTPNAHQQ